MVVRARIAVMLSVFILLSAFWQFGSSWVSWPIFVPELEAGEHLKRVPLLTLMSDQVDRMGNFLTSLIVGTFLLVGLCFQRVAEKSTISIGRTIMGILFIAAAFASLYFVYAARMQALEYSGYGYADFSSISPSIGRSALFLAVAAAIALTLTVDALVVPQASPPPAEAAKPVGQTNQAIDGASLPAAPESVQLGDTAAPKITTSATSRPTRKVRQSAGNAGDGSKS